MVSDRKREIHSAEDLVEIVGWYVRNALLGEVYATPKPGLVDRRDTGAHRDMNYETFLRSTEAITPYLVEMFKRGLVSSYENDELTVEKEPADSQSKYKSMETKHTPNLSSREKVFLDIRKTGMEAEKAMYKATGNVNTHKGMIFTMGILLAAAGIIAGERLRQNAAADISGDFFEINEILETGRRMSQRILEEDFIEMSNREPISHGEKLFHKYGEKGIRGQAMVGFPIIRDIGLSSMRKYLNITDDASLRCEIEERATLRKDLLDGEGNMRDEHFENAVNISTLIAIMSRLNDTNVLTRSSYEEMEWLKKESERIVKLGAAFSKEGLSAIEELNVKCIEKNISPGGAADILAVTILLLKLEGISYV